QLRAELAGELEGDAHALVAVRGAVDADHEAAALERPSVAHDQHVLLDAAHDARDDPAKLAEPLPAEPVRADDQHFVGTRRRAGQLLVVLLVLGDEPAALADADVAADTVAAVVLARDVGVEPDQARQPSLAPVRLPDQLLVVDALEELARERNAGRVAAALDLVQEAVRDELEALLDQLVVDLPLPLDLLGSLELGGQARLELAEADVVEAGRVDMAARDPASGPTAYLDRALDGPRRVRGVVHGDEDLAVHDHLGRPGIRRDPSSLHGSARHSDRRARPVLPGREPGARGGAARPTRTGGLGAGGAPTLDSSWRRRMSYFNRHEGVLAPSIRSERPVLSVCVRRHRA